jgi:hypothetical protein
MPPALRIARFQTSMVDFDALFGLCVGRLDRHHIWRYRQSRADPPFDVQACPWLPDIAWKGIANPIGPAGALMLEQFKLIRSRGVGVLQDTAHRRSQTNLDINRLRA